MEDISLNVSDSPNTKKQLNSLKIDKRRLEIEKEKEKWSGCCSKSDKEFIKYITQIIMGSFIMIFSAIMIALTDDNKEIYFSLLSGTFGLFLPHPQIKD